MAHRQLVTHLLARRAAGLDQGLVRAEVKAAGWSEDDVMTAESEVKRLLSIPTVPVAPKQRHHLSPTDSLLFLGGLVVLAGAVLLFAPSWSDWGPGWRILAAVVPALALLVTGDRIWSSQQQNHSAFVFLLIGGLLMPVALGVTVWEIFSGAGLEAQKFLLTSTLAGGLYALAAGRYRHLAWTVLTCIATVGIFFSMLAWIEPDSLQTWLWAGTVYGAILFSSGLWLELNKKVFEARSPYFFGAGALVISLGVLGLSGLMFSAESQYSGTGQAIAQAKSTLVVGVIFILISWLGRKFQQRQLGEASLYTRAWDFFGALGIALAPLLLGLNDSYKAFTFLALGAAVGIMAAAVRWQLRFWFYAAAVVLMAALIRIGAGLFPDSALWPVMLLVIGPLIMGSGYVLLKLQSRLFQKTEPTKLEPPV